MKRSGNPREFLTAEEARRLDAAVKEAEKQTSGEIKVVLIRHCWTNIHAKAAQLFAKHGLDKTERRNCAMILLVLANREFLIYGDEGIHEKVGQGFWDDVRDAMLDKFKKDEFGEGLCIGVQRIGEKLAHYFPYQADDKEEIPDDVAYED